MKKQLSLLTFLGCGLLTASAAHAAPNHQGASSGSPRKSRPPTTLTPPQRSTTGRSPAAVTALTAGAGALGRNFSLAAEHAGPGTAGRYLGAAGKGLSGAGYGVAALQAGNDIRKGRYGSALDRGVGTAVGVGASTACSAGATAVGGIGGGLVTRPLCVGFGAGAGWVGTKASQGARKLIGKVF